MRYRDAKKLQPGDEVTTKRTPTTHKVVEVEAHKLNFHSTINFNPNRPFVLIRVENGTTLYHDEIK